MEEGTNRGSFINRRAHIPASFQMGLSVSVHAIVELIKQEGKSMVEISVSQLYMSTVHYEVHAK